MVQFQFVLWQLPRAHTEHCSVFVSRAYIVDLILTSRLCQSNSIDYFFISSLYFKTPPILYIKSTDTQWLKSHVLMFLGSDAIVFGKIVNVSTYFQSYFCINTLAAFSQSQWEILPAPSYLLLIWYTVEQINFQKLFHNET